MGEIMESITEMKKAVKEYIKKMKQKQKIIEIREEIYKLCNIMEEDSVKRKKELIELKEEEIVKFLKKEDKDIIYKEIIISITKLYKENLVLISNRMFEKCRNVIEGKLISLEERLIDIQDDESTIEEKKKVKDLQLYIEESNNIYKTKL